MFAWKSLLGVVAVSLLASSQVEAAVLPFPAQFRTFSAANADGSKQYVRVGGSGPAVVLLHGFGDTGDMWEPLASALVKDHTVVVPDLRGMGLSSHQDGGYEKAAQARDLAKVLDGIGIKQFQLVTHDIGNMVGYALAAQQRDRVTAWVVMDAPLPGLGHWDDQYRNPKTWHFNFRGPDVERLVSGRERILLDRFYDDLSANPSHVDEATRVHYAELYARPQAIHDAFEQFAAFEADGRQNQAFVAQGKLRIPVLAIGGEQSYGLQLADEIRVAAENVKPAVVRDSGHWLMEEQPAATTALITSFLAGAQSSAGAAQVRMTPQEIQQVTKLGDAPGTSGKPGIVTTVLSGNPSMAGPYSVELSVPAHTSIDAHSHRDERTAVVVSGVWQFGYGETANAAALKKLPPGSFYTEPAGEPHFARTGDAPVMVVINGYGPTDTTYVDASKAPARE